MTKCKYREDTGKQWTEIAKRQISEKALYSPALHKMLRISETFFKFSWLYIYVSSSFHSLLTSIFGQNLFYCRWVSFEILITFLRKYIRGWDTAQIQAQDLADIVRHCIFMLRQGCHMLQRDISEEKNKARPVLSMLGELTPAETSWDYSVTTKLREMCNNKHEITAAGVTVRQHLSSASWQEQQQSDLLWSWLR